MPGEVDTAPAIQNAARPATLREQVKYGIGSIPAGAVDSAATMLSGAGGLTQAGKPESDALRTRIISASTGTPGQIAAVRREIDTAPYLSDAARQAAHAGLSDLLDRAIAPEEFPQLAPGLAGEKPEQNPLYAAGQAVHGAADAIDPTPPEIKDAIGPQIGKALGSTAAFLPAGMAGAVPLAVAGGLSGAGEAYEAALKAKATPEQAAQAAVAGIAPGLIDALPIDNLVRPFGPLAKLAADRLGHSIYRAAEQAILEGGTEGLQQFIQNVIAKAHYDASKDVFDEVGWNALLGGIVGGGMGAVTGAAEGPQGAEVRDTPSPIPPAPADAMGTVQLGNRRPMNAPTGLANLRPQDAGNSPNSPVPPGAPAQPIVPPVTQPVSPPVSQPIVPPAVPGQPQHGTAVVPPVPQPKPALPPAVNPAPPQPAGPGATPTSVSGSTAPSAPPPSLEETIRATDAGLTPAEAAAVGTGQLERPRFAKGEAAVLPDGTTGTIAQIRRHETKDGPTFTFMVKVPGQKGAKPFSPDQLTSPDEIKAQQEQDEQAALEAALAAAPVEDESGEIVEEAPEPELGASSVRSYAEPGPAQEPEGAAVSAVEAVPEPTPAPPEAPAAKKPESQANSVDDLHEFGKLGGGVADSLHDMLFAKYQRGETDELGRPSLYLRAAKYLRDNGRELTRDELQKLTNELADAKDKAKGAKDQLAYEASLNEVVQRWMPEKPVKVISGEKVTPEASEIDAAAAETAEPTPAQAEAGNYKKGRVKVHGLDISIETAKGKERTGVGKDGKPWSVTMPAHYGDIKGTEGADGDAVDVYLGDYPDSDRVFVVDQIDPATGKFDEHKVVLGVRNRDAARRLYEGGFSDGSGRARMGSITPLSMSYFKEWLKGGKRKEPLSYKSTVQEDEEPTPLSSESGPSSPAPEPIKKTPSESPELNSSPDEARPKSEPEWKKGDRVRVTKGPNAGKEATLTEAHGIIWAPALPSVRKPGFTAIPGMGGPRTWALKGKFDDGRETHLIASQVEKIGEAAPEPEAAPAPEAVPPALKKEADRLGVRIVPAATPGWWSVEDDAPTPKVSYGANTWGEVRRWLNKIKAERKKATPAAKPPESTKPEKPAETATAPEPKGKAKKPKPAPAPAPTETNETSAAPAYGSANTTFTADAAAKARELLKKKLNGTTLNSGFDPEVALAGLTLAGYHIEAGTRTFAAYAKTMIEELGENARPFLKYWYDNVRTYPGFDATGMSTPEEIERFLKEGEAKEEPAPAPVPDKPKATEDGGDPLVTALRDALWHGELKTWADARKLAKERTGAVIDPGTPEAKELDEAIERASVLAARGIIEGAKEAGLSPAKIYPHLVSLYEKMPKLGVRTSGSIERQAYSTPVPLAYVASRLAGIGPETSVYEPTAGNGALLIEATPKGSGSLANELDPKRAAFLRSLGFPTTLRDAAEQGPGRYFDAVVMNPPFGGVKEGGQNKRFPIKQDGETLFDTSEVDHAIAWKALTEMHADGRAVLILGGPNPQVIGKGVAYRTGAKQRFYYALYQHYNVVEHVTVDGKLYERQGAGWPVDVIVIEGKGKSARPLPAKQPPRVLSSWDQVGELLSGQPRAAASADAGASGDLAGGVPDGGRGAGPTERPGSDDAGGAPAPALGTDSVAPEDGAGTGRGGAGGKPNAGGGRPPRNPRERDEPAAGDPQLDSDSGAAGRPGGGAADEAQPAPNGAGADAGSDPAAAAGGLGKSPDPVASGPAGKAGLNAAKERMDALRDGTADPVEWPAKNSLDEHWPRQNREPSLDQYVPEAIRDEALRVMNLAQDAFGRAGYRDLTEINSYTAPTNSPVNQARKAYSTLGGVLSRYAKKAEAHEKGFKGSREVDANELAQELGELQSELSSTRAIIEWANGETPQIEGAPAPEAKPTKVVQNTPKSTTKPPTKETKEAEADPASGRQVAYKARSKSGTPVGTLTPVNMAKGADAALAALEKRVGPVDKFVATKLDYKPADLPSYFSAEQIDALGLAIDNLERNKGFIIGDQTGVGKGRINAAIIRWAMKNGRTPIFLTEKPNLYADMIRDLSDIGMSNFKPLVTNNSLSGSDAIPLPNGDTIRTKQDHVQELMHAANVGQLVDRSGQSYDAVFTTYNQLQQVNSENTARNHFVERFLPGAVLIMDESHNGGGSGAKQRPNKKKPHQQTRSAILRDYVSRASSVFYSSATYAKRPDSMSLYSKTDMSLASDDPKKLEAAFAKGGVGLQQVAASMLTESGQYLRRERSFAGVEFATKTMPVSRTSAENAATGMREIVSFEAEVIRPIITGMKEDNAGSGSASGGDAGEVHSTNFTSIMHNIIDQMLLAMKADAAADEAIASLKAGEKPVIAVANTMGSMIEEITRNEDIKPGQRLDFTFKDVMLRYLERTRWYTEGNAYGKKERKYLTDADLGPEGVKAFKAAQAAIRSLDFGSIPGSPIDHLHARLHAAGYKVGEITGRSATIDYTAPAKGAVYRVRPQAEKSKGSVVKTIERFNGGAANRPVPQDQRLDVLIINQSGATGLSLHASEKFADQRRRRMIIAQAERNIDIFMQMLGRIHRTGQVIAPAYSLATADIPAEKRPAAVLAKKLASLNANTTASAEGDVATGTDDFMNEVGDEVANSLMQEDGELWVKLGAPGTTDDDGKVLEGAMRRVTGRIPLLPVAEQEDLYTKLEALYAQAVERKKAMGENVGSAETLDLQARPILRTTIFPGKEGSDSPFAKPAYLAQMSVKRLGKPMTSAEVKAAVEKGGREVGLDGSWLLNQLASEFGPFLEKRLSALKEEESRERQRRVLEGMRNHVERLLQHHVGETVKLSTDDQNFYGVIVGIEKRDGLKNPAAPSGWQMKIAVADPVRQLNVPFSSLYAPDQVGKDGVGKGGVIVEPFEGTVDLHDGEPGRTVHDLFDHLQSGSREKRYMVTGNVMAGFTALKAKGKIVFYTDDKGQTQAGVLMPKGYKADLTGADTPQVLTDPEHIMQFVTRSDEPVKTGDGELRLMFGRQGYEIMAPASKARGGQYFMDKDLIAAAGKEFVKAGQMMMVRGLNQIQTRTVIQIIQRKFGPLAAWTQQRMARQIAGLPEPEVERFDDKGEPAKGGPQFSARTGVALIDTSPVNGLPSLTPEEKASAAHTSWAQPTPKMLEERAEVIRRATTIMREMNPSYAAEFAARLFGAGPQVKDSGAKSTDWVEVGGVTYADEQLIRLSLNVSDKDLIEAAGHEGWHSIERLLPEADTAILRKAFPASGTRSQVEEIAYAFQEWFGNRETGRVQGPARRIFAKVARFLQRLGNMLRGMGFKSAEDVFEKARGGGYAPDATTKARSGVAFALRNAADTLKSLGYTHDNPGGRWLAEQRARAMAAKRPGSGSTTATLGLMRPVTIAVGKLRDLPGARGEEAHRRNDAKMDALREVVAREGWNPDAVMVWVDHDGTARIAEGNHRVALADELGIERIPVDIRYFAGGEEANGRLNPERLATEGAISPPAEQPQFSIAGGGIRPTLKQRVDARLDPARYALQDSLIFLQRAQERAEERDGPLSVAEDARLAAELYSGRTGQRLEQAEEKLFRPLVKELHASGLSKEQVGDWLYARHAAERNEQIRTIDPKNDAGSGMTDEEADDILAQAKADGHEPAMLRIAKIVDQITNESVDIRERAGLLSPEEADGWRKYASYVPLRGFEESPDEADGPKVGKGFDVRGKESERATGRGSKAPSGDILGNVMMLHEEAIVRAEKNRVDQKLLVLVTAHPDPDTWRVYRPKVKKIVDKRTGMVRKQVINEAWRKENVVALKVKGQPVHLEFIDERIARGVKGLDNANLGRWVRMLQSTISFYTAVRTRWNPEFFMGNFPADVQTALVNIQDTKSIAGAIARDVFPAFAGIMKATKGNDTGLWARQYREFEKNGGAVKFFGMKDVAEQRKRVEAMARELGKQPLYKMPWRTLVKVEQNIVAPFNDAAENAVRLATYTNLVRVGIHPDRAAAAAKNVTVNFNKRGAASPFLRVGWAFANASIQGTTRMAQALVKSKRVRAIAGSVVLTSALLDVLNGFLSPDDDDGEKRYDKIEPWVKDSHILIANPWAENDDASSQTLLKLRMPYGYNIFAVLGRMIGEQMRAGLGMGPKLSAVQQAIHLGAVTLDAFNPLGGSSMPLIPTLGQPLVELWTNENFFGSKISPERRENGDHREDNQLFWDSNPAWMRWLAKEVADATRGADDKPVVDVSPESIEHITDFVIGTTGAFVKRSADVATKVWNGEWEDVAWSQVPFARRAVEGRNRYRTKDRYYTIRDDIDAAEGKLKDAEPAARMALRQKLQPELRAKGQFDSIEKRRKELSKRARQAEARGHADRAKDIDKRIEGMMTDAIAAYNKAVEATGAVRH